MSQDEAVPALARWRNSILEGGAVGSTGRAGRAPDYWGLIQIVAAHPHPARCLFLGATLGGDVLGAAALGASVVVGDPRPVSLPPARTEKMDPSKFRALPERFDIVFVTPWWIEEATRSGVGAEKLLLDARKCLEPNGRLVMQYRTAGSAALVRVLTRREFNSERLRDLPRWSSLSVAKELRRAGFENVTTYRMAGSTLAPRKLLSDSLPADQILGWLFEKEAQGSLPPRGLPLRALLALGVSRDFAFLFSVVSASFAPNAPGAPRVLWTRMPPGGRTAAALVERDGERWFVRLDPGRGEVRREAELLELLSRDAGVAPYVHAPEERGELFGMTSAWYCFLPGTSMARGDEPFYKKEIREFLERLASVPPPPWLESVAGHLRQKLLKRNLGVDQLESLMERGVFRWIMHGELRAHNIHVVYEGRQPFLKFLDWATCRLGHPLLDWWTALYWRALPAAGPEAPRELQRGLSGEEVDRLWRLWIDAVRLPPETSIF